MSKKLWYVRRKLKGQRKLFPSDKLTVDGRYTQLTAAEEMRLLNWANSAPF